MRGKKVFWLLVVFIVMMTFFGASGLYAEKKEAEEYLIGLSLWADTGPLATRIISFMRYSAGVLGAKVEVNVDGFVPEGQIASVENFVARGCDAVIIAICSDAVTPKLLKICEEADIPLGIMFRTINDPEIMEFAMNSDAFAGNCHEDEVAVGYNLGLALAEKGCKNAAIINYTKGDTTAGNRYVGYTKAFKETGINLLAEQWNILEAEKAANAAESFITAFPELDAICIGGGGGEPLAGAIRAVKNHNKIGDICITASDFGPDLVENMRNKEISAMSGGHFVDAFFTLMLLYNYIDGTPLSDKPETIVMEPIYVTSAKEAENYQKYCNENNPYTAEEIKKMTVRYNKDFTIDDLKRIAASYSLEDVMERHAQ